MFDDYESHRPDQCLDTCQALEETDPGAAIVAWIALLTGRDAYQHLNHYRGAILGVEHIGNGLSLVHHDVSGERSILRIAHRFLDIGVLLERLENDHRTYAEVLVHGGAQAFDRAVGMSRMGLAKAGARMAISEGRLDSFARDLGANPDELERMAWSPYFDPDAISDALRWWREPYWKY